jgi:hypothetical protein
MHDRLSEILDQQVAGEIRLVGETLMDVGLGRICLERLERPGVDALLARLRDAFGAELEIRDRLHLQDPEPLIRGLLEVTLPDPGGGSGYLLQITAAPVCALYERRFSLEPGVSGDLMGTLCEGLIPLLGAAGQRALRQLCDFDGLQGAFREHLDRAIQAAIDGQPGEPERWVGELAARARDCWQMTPWPLRAGLRPASTPGEGRSAAHDGGGGNTVLLAANVVDGVVVSEYTHVHQELEEYGQVLGWICEVHQALAETYPPPEHQTALARAASVQQLMTCYPRLQGMVAPRG